MNIKITHSWLLEHLDTTATPEDIQKYVTLCGPSIERIEKVDNEIVYDIEVTTNRVDAASVMGFAREAAAILPQFSVRAALKSDAILNVVTDLELSNVHITIEDPEALVSRVSAVVLEDVVFGPSPQFMIDRLEACGIRSLNAIVDITNYVMLEIGHPIHAFDLDKIKTNKLIFRKAKDGEKLTTLDKKTYELTTSDVIIDDGTGRVIDLPGIMGAFNTAVDENTKRVLLFSESNNAGAIRKTCLTHGLRTHAATINEKSPDPHKIPLALNRAVALYAQYAGVKKTSEKIDIYPTTPKIKTVTTSLASVENLLGVTVEYTRLQKILTDLGFGVSLVQGKDITVSVPSWRNLDISIEEDIIEEIARIYGYSNLPSQLQKTDVPVQPQDVQLLFDISEKLRWALKHNGFTEVYNYSMVSRDLLDALDLAPDVHLRLSNSISTELEFMRTTLAPSLLKNLSDNRGVAADISLFEISRIYRKSTNSLPDEIPVLSLCTTADYFMHKGVIEYLLRECNINSIEFIKGTDKQYLDTTLSSTLVTNKGETVGYIGQVTPICADHFGLKKAPVVSELNVEVLARLMRKIPTYIPVNPYAVIKLDYTVKLDSTSYGTFIKQCSQNIEESVTMTLLDVFENNITLRFEISDRTKNIVESQAKESIERALRLSGAIIQ